MTYLPTIDEDLARARQILARGKQPRPPFGTGILPHGEQDVYAAYKLLESFVEEIERLRAEVARLTRNVSPP